MRFIKTAMQIICYLVLCMLMGFLFSWLGKEIQYDNALLYYFSLVFYGNLIFLVVAILGFLYLRFSPKKATKNG